MPGSDGGTASSKGAGKGLVSPNSANLRRCHPIAATFPAGPPRFTYEPPSNSSGDKPDLDPC
jgi:hypothetical protein